MSKRIPASIRNNNTGAMEPGPSSKKFGSASYETLRWEKDGKPHTNRIAKFSTPVHGAAAHFDLLHRKYTGVPLKSAVERWCGGYWAGEYAATVEKRCGIAADDTLTKAHVKDPSVAIPIAKAMARMEAGREFPMSDEDWQAAHAMAFGSGLAPAPTPDNDVPFQKPEGRARETRNTVAKVGAAITAAGGAVTQAVPAVPAAYITNVANAQSWQSLGDQIAGLAKWAIASPLALAIIAATAALLFLPKLIGGRA